MKKVKFSFGEGGFKGFMARHVEKCVLGAVILLMVVFIYSAAGTNPLGSENITTAAMKQQAESARSKIQSSSFSEVVAERQPGKDPSVVVRQKAKVDSGRYQWPTSFDIPLFQKLKPRTDPRLVPPENLVVTPLYGPLMLMPEREDDYAIHPLDKFETTLGGGGYGAMGGSSYPGMSPPGPGSDDDDGKAPRRGRREASTNPYGPMGPGGGSSIGPTPMGDSGKQPRTPRRGKEDGSNPYETPGPTGTGYGSTAIGGQRQIPSEALLGVRGAPGMEVKPAYAMVINATVNYPRQWEEYQTAFASAPGGQDPSRDVPFYIGVRVDRADVTDNPDADPETLEWTRLPPAALRSIQERYGEAVPEISDPEALDQYLTNPVPPFLLTNLIPALRHPDIERASMVESRYEEDDEEMHEVDEFGFSDDEGDGYGRGGPSMPGGAPRGPSMGPSPRGGRSPGPAMPGGPRTSTGPGASMGPRMGGAGMGAGMTGYGGGEMSLRKPVAKKQVRYVDFDVEPGRVYRYRMLVVLEDPNRPREASMAPEITSLDDKARDRVRALEAEDARKSQAAGRAVRTYFVSTPLSEPSAAAKLPSTDRFFAGEGTPGSVIRMDRVIVPTGDPQAKMLTVKFDAALGAFIPAELAAQRGAALNTKQDVEAIHPLENDLRKIPDYAMRTDAVVLDVLGGDYLPGTDRNAPERSPGAALLIDAQGNLHVADEAIDVGQYRRFIFPETEKKTGDTQGYGAGPPPPGSDSMGPTPGYPGSNQKGKNPRSGPGGYPGGGSIGPMPGGAGGAGGRPGRTGR
jgi:hypothetical protein